MRLANVLGWGRRTQVKTNGVPLNTIAQPAERNTGSFVFQAKFFLTAAVAMAVMLSIESSEKQLMTAFVVGAMAGVTRWERAKNFVNKFASGTFTILCAGAYLTIAFGLH